ncbi:complement C3-like isoform X1 [Rana temporaria]|uniref:complement C3-like isoform X1 n=1 Tax=Rana temporaria TaxID=8407 RepID=UPI001AADCF22|nr:complement C3-like isoform X1 [Rana temporaria]
MIMSRYFSFLPVLLCIQLSIRLTACKQFFVLMAPNILRAGNEETIVIQCHECEKNQTVDINVNSFQDKLMYKTVVTLHKSNDFLDTAYINIPPSFLSSDLTEKQYVIVQATSREITLKRVILLSPDTGHIFIQTSKTIYTPNQNVNYRIFSTDKNLDPTERNVEIMLENPEGIIVNKDTRVIKNGIFSFTMKIPELVTFGMWKLVAKFENAPQREYTTQFEVREYVLPTFSVELDTTNKFFYYKDDELVVNIKAKYLFGENVNGYAVAIFGLYKDFLKTLQGSMQREQIVKGEGHVTLTRKQLLEGVSDETELLGVSIYVNVTVFSSEGDYVQVHKTNIRIVSSPYNIAFTRTPTYFKPGMPLTIMVLVTNPDMTPAFEIPVQCGKELVVTSEEGLAYITVNTQSGDKDLEITVKTAEKSLPDDQQASVTLKAKAYQSPYWNFLHINANLKGKNVADITLYIKSQDMETRRRINYFTILVISRGKILQTKVQRRTVGEEITSLRIALTPEMLPSFRIVAYYYLVYLNSILEIVSDSVWLHMKRTCKSNLQINPPKSSQNTYEPERSVELTLTGDQGSQVGLVVVDKAVFVLNNKGRFTQDKIWDEVQEDDLGCSAGSGENALGVFQDAGLDFGTTMELGTPSRKDFTCTTKLHNRRRRSYELLAAKQKKASESPAHLRPCCLAGLHESPMGLDCTSRKKHVQEQECADLFFECCIHAEKLREQMSKDLEWERSDDDVEDVPDDVSPRSFFPESWFWHIYELKNPKSDPKSSIVTMPLTLNLPSSVTTWIVQAVSIKKNQGICVSNAYPLTVSMKFFVDLRMPYSVRRNEQVQIRAVVHNYFDEKQKVTVKFSYIENVCSLATKSRGYQVPVQVEAQSTKVVNYVIIPLKAETIHIEVQVYGSNIRDKVKKSIDVLPEGKLERKKTFNQAVNPKGRSELLHVKKEELDGIVPNSPANYFISVQGDIMGESLLGILDESYLGRLLYIPSGCPEQNMFKTSTNVIVTRYLDANKKWGIVGAEKRLKAIHNIGQGYIQQLAHHLPDHSFQKSTWLTAYVVKIFAMAYSLAGIDKDMLCNSLKWLATKQNPSGEFIESGQVYSKAMQGGYIKSESSSSLTAFVLIALAEAKERCDIKEVQDAMQKAKKYLENKLLSLKQTYSAVITSYALALVGSTKNEDFIDHLADKTGTVWVVEKSGLYTVEATGYALLQKLKLRKYEQAQKIANWLVGIRSFGGGYDSTQATIVALQALTQYKTDVAPDTDVNLNVQLVVEGRADPLEYTILNKDAYLERTNKIPGNRDLTFNITGRGECTVTVMTVYYSLLTSEKKCNGFILQAVVTADEKKTDTYTLKMQTRYNGSVPATMTLIEITMLTGFTPNIEDLKRLSSKVENYIMTYETQESTSNASVVLYLTKVPHNETLSIGFRIHKTTEVGLLQPADISIYEYYDLDKKCSTFYNLPDESWQLRKLCKGSACKCATGACASLGKATDLKEKACSEGIDFVFRVRVTKTERESSYDYNDVTIVDIIKDDIKTRSVGATMKLVSHLACSESLNLQINSEYLIMNHYSDLWEVSPLTSFVLSSKTFIFDWSEGDEALTDFASNMKDEGCST